MPLAVDPLWESVSVLCPFTSDTASVAAQDASIYMSGGYISDEQSRWGDASLLFPGSSDYLRIGNLSLLPSMGDDFCIEGYTRISAWANPRGTVMDLYQSSTNGIRLVVTSSGVARLELVDDFLSINHPNTIALDTWTHWAVSRDSGVFRLYLDGVSAPPASSDLNLAPSALYIAASGANVTMDELQAYYSDLRVTLGAARYVTDFSPPLEAFPSVGWAIDGLVYDADGAPAERALRAYRRDTGAFAADATSNVGGVFSMGFKSPGEHSIVCLSDNSIDQDIVKRVTVG